MENISSKHEFLVLGRAGLDLYAYPPGTRTEDALMFSAALGGSAANIAAGIARLGGDVDLITAVSDDAVGRYTLNELKKFGGGTQDILTVRGEARNSLAVVETRIQNCQSVIYRNGAADFQIDKAHIQSIPYTDYNTLIITGTCLALEPSRSAKFLAIELAKKAALKIVIDVDYRPYSWMSSTEAATIYAKAAARCDTFIGNDVEFAVMANGDGLAYAKSLSRNNDKIIVYKMDEKGSISFWNKIEFRTSILPVAALKPTGAGDAFIAAFMMGHESKLNLQSCVSRGSAAAPIDATRIGCAPAMPTEIELQNFMVTHAHSTL